MARKKFPVGIYNGEIFIIDTERNKEDGHFSFDVIRYVTDSQLEYLRDPDERRDEYKEFWQQAVQAGTTEDGLDDWLESIWDEEMDEDDPESYPGKDESDCDAINEEERKAADEFIEESRGVTVGTWESSGAYSPGSFDGGEFKGWDFMFDTPEARKWAKKYAESKKR